MDTYAVRWLEHCRYGVKHKTINQSVDTYVVYTDTRHYCWLDTPSFDHSPAVGTGTRSHSPCIAIYITQKHFKLLSSFLIIKLKLWLQFKGFFFQHIDVFFENVDIYVCCNDNCTSMSNRKPQIIRMYLKNIDLS